ncbi:hypothetical protein HPB49_008285 [Dermacentor silvarum]|uniref:Uncharacterized protein n=1 Tax=Dermacentor silvarum TaxID=543639 RepID=A0ACB8DXW8_DERSI|nr:hypothetical protein HPB49_008285 [Dermacentor silvarum]
MSRAPRSATARRKHGVPENNVRRWRKEKEALFACAATRKAFRGPRKGVFPEVEASLTEFVRQTRSRALTVTTEMLQLKAREFAKDRGISGPRNGLDTVGPFEAGISVGSSSLDSRRLGSYTRRYMVAASFKKCCISNSLDGTDDSEVWECTSNKESSDASDDDSS